MVYQIGGLILGEVVFGPATVAAFVVLAAVLYLLFRRDPNRLRRQATDQKGAYQQV